MKRLVVGILLGLLFAMGTNGFAAEGYKNFKFGMSENTVREILSKEYCEPVPGCIGAVFTPGVEHCVHCKAFPFGGEKIVIVLTFIDDKLCQVRLFPPKEMEVAAKNVLTKKYNLNLKKEGSKPGYNYFGDGTIYFIDAGEENNATIVYEIANYDSVVAQKNKKIKKIESLLEDEL